MWLPNSILDPVQYNLVHSFELSCICGCMTSDTNSHIFMVVPTADESNMIKTANFWHQIVTCRGGGGGTRDENNGF
jgi:hypothetical protein